MESDDATGALLVTGPDAASIGDMALTEGIALHELTPRLSSLEDIYTCMTVDSVDYRAQPAGAPTMMALLVFGRAAGSEWFKLRTARTSVGLAAAVLLLIPALAVVVGATLSLQPDAPFSAAASPVRCWPRWPGA